MVPFLWDDLTRLTRNIMSRFIKADVINEANSVIDIDVSKADNYVTHRKVDVGFSTADELRKQLNDKKISERMVMDFREKAWKCFRDIVTKIAAKSPLKYEVIRHMKWLDPREMARDYDAGASLLQKLLHDLVATTSGSALMCPHSSISTLLMPDWMSSSTNCSTPPSTNTCGA